MAYEVTLADDSVEWVDNADTYQQEGPMTTFFDNAAQRTRLDCWSVKVASFRTERIIKILRRPAGAPVRRAPSWGVE